MTFTMKHLVRIGCSLLVLSAVATTAAAVAQQDSFVAPSTITVTMYQLANDGSSTDRLCSPANNNLNLHGCSDDRMHDYPYKSSVVEVDIEKDYLLDVVPRESDPAEIHPTAVQAQAVAARSYAYWHSDNPNPNRPINNSTEFQVFIPYAFERTSRAAGSPFNAPNDPDDPCASDNLNAYQQIVCAAVVSRGLARWELVRAGLVSQVVVV